MDNNTVYVTSVSDHTIVMFVPELMLNKTWNKRGQRYPIPRETLIQAYYNPSVEYLFKEGILTTDDKEFLFSVGLASEDGSTEVINLTEELEQRMIKLMPVADLKNYLVKLSRTQLTELAEYAVSHYQDLKMDRIDLLSQVTGKNLLKSIENYKASLEG